jgi:cytochrome c biogenesis protein CcmG/thiol:disulfide interchange protein DsbE
MSEDQAPKSSLWLAAIPLVVFLGLAGLFYTLLSTEGRDVSALPSALLNDPAPVIVMPELTGAQQSNKQIPGFSAQTLKGKLSVVNVFASWCVPCRQEHPQIVEIGNDPRVQLVGLNHKDGNRNALSFLEELGNPYDVIGVDRNGRASIEWGVYGVPETFLVDEEGIIFYKHVGPISPAQLEKVIKPLLEQKLASTN